MVGGAIARPAATPEPDMRLSPHPADRSTHRDLCGVCQVTGRSTAMADNPQK